MTNQEVSIASTSPPKTVLLSSGEIWRCMPVETLLGPLKEALKELDGQTIGTGSDDLAEALAPILAKKMSYRVG